MQWLHIHVLQGEILYCLRKMQSLCKHLCSEIKCSRAVLQFPNVDKWVQKSTVTTADFSAYKTIQCCMLCTLLHILLWWFCTWPSTVLLCIKLKAELCIDEITCWVKANNKTNKEYSSFLKLLYPWKSNCTLHKHRDYQTREHSPFKQFFLVPFKMTKKNPGCWSW